MTDQASAHQIEYLRLLADRMERLSADSIWARRASGLRRSLYKALTRIESGDGIDAQSVRLLTDACLSMLRKAAMEIPDPDQIKAGSNR